MRKSQSPCNKALLIHLQFPTHQPKICILCIQWQFDYFAVVFFKWQIKHISEVLTILVLKLKQPVILLKYRVVWSLSLSVDRLVETLQIISECINCYRILQLLFTNASMHLSSSCGGHKECVTFMLKNVFTYVGGYECGPQLLNPGGWLAGYA